MPVRKPLALCGLLLLGPRPSLAQQPARCTAPAGAAVLVYGGVASPVSISAAELRTMKRASFRAGLRDGRPAVFDGVAVWDVLARAGLPRKQGDEELTGYAVIEAADGSRVLFALPELDPGFGEGVPLLADAQDGAPVAAPYGPLRVVVPGDTSRRRWVHQVTCIRVARDAASAAPSRAAMIHQHGAMVMPFDLSATRHIFEMTVRGGIQQVVLRTGADSAQLPLIRRHLREEARRFGAGDFSDPMRLHGADMPGVRELAAAAARLRVSYAELPDGAQITFEAADPALVTAVHRWFGAQLSDHGADAVAR